MSPAALDIDWRLRLAAFDALRRPTESEGWIIRREQMTAGFEFDGERVPFALRARGIWKPARLGTNGAALSITTASIRRGVTPRYDDQIASDHDWFEYRYQGTDPNAADNRAVRRAGELGRPLIYFYGIGPGRYEAVLPVYVVGDEPAKLTFKIAADAAGLGDPRFMSGGAEAPLKAYATAAVKRRLHQHRFRELVVAAYQERCTICRLHHGIDPGYRVHIRMSVLEESDGPMLRHGIQEMAGATIVVPPEDRLKPRRDYLEERFARFNAA